LPKEHINRNECLKENDLCRLKAKGVLRLTIRVGLAIIKCKTLNENGLEE
jgi:hypothetical protein